MTIFFPDKLKKLHWKNFLLYTFVFIIFLTVCMLSILILSDDQNKDFFNYYLLVGGIFLFLTVSVTLLNKNIKQEKTKIKSCAIKDIRATVSDNQKTRIYLKDGSKWLEGKKLMLYLVAFAVFLVTCSLVIFFLEDNENKNFSKYYLLIGVILFLLSTSAGLLIKSMRNVRLKIKRNRAKNSYIDIFNNQLFFSETRDVITKTAIIEIIFCVYDTDTVVPLETPIPDTAVSIKLQNKDRLRFNKKDLNLVQFKEGLKKHGYANIVKSERRPGYGSLH